MTDNLAEIAYQKFWTAFNATAPADNTTQIIKYANLSKEQVEAWQATVTAVVESYLTQTSTKA